MATVMKLLLQEYDAVVVCNGHYSEPNLPNVAGSDSWPGLQMHSHNYRTPDVFRDQVVVVVGASNSGNYTACQQTTVSSKQQI